MKTFGSLVLGTVLGIVIAPKVKKHSPVKLKVCDSCGQQFMAINNAPCPECKK